MSAASSGDSGRTVHQPVLVREVLRLLAVETGQIVVDGPDLVVTAARPLPDKLMFALRTHKSEVLAELQLAQRRWGIFEYRLRDNPYGWLVFIAPGYDLARAKRSLRGQFGDRIVAVREKR